MSHVPQLKNNPISTKCKKKTVLRVFETEQRSSFFGPKGWISPSRLLLSMMELLKKLVTPDLLKKSVVTLGLSFCLTWLKEVSFTFFFFAVTFGDFGGKWTR